MRLSARLTNAGIVGLSVWCAAGWLSVAADDPSVRLVVPASPLWALGGAVLASLLPGFDRFGRALPALFSVWPWLPLPTPAVALVFTGPMAWLPIGATVLAPFLSRFRAPDGAPARPRVQALSAAGLTFVLALLTTVSVAGRLPGGDEPHYLIITNSLLGDGDLRMENNHENRDYAAYFAGDLRPDFIQRGQDGEIYSIHAPGVSALVAPGFAVAGYPGAQATILLAAALTGWLVWLTGWRASGRTDAAWFAWAAVTITPTALLLSGMVFPDGPGALAVAAGVWLLVCVGDRGWPVRSGAVVAVSAALAALPWLHTRFSVLAGGLGLAIVFSLWRRGAGVRMLAAFTAIPVVLAAAWFASFRLIYGTWNPAAPYGANADSKLAFVPGGLTALLFDAQFGLLPYAPILLAALVAVAARANWLARVAAAIGLAYAAAAATYWMWWAGLPAPPARFLTAALPLAVPALVAFWVRATEPTRGALLAGAGLSAAIAVLTVGVGQGALAWNTRDGQAAWLEWLGPVVNLPRAWPSFFWRLDPANLATEWPFALHALVFALVLGAAFWLTSRAVSREAALTRATAVVPLTVVALAMGGWSLNGVNGLDPARAQTRVLAAAASGRPLVRLAPLSVGAVSPAAAGMRIRPDEPGRTDEAPPWAYFENLPPGRYELDIETSAPSGPIALTIGRSPEPFRTIVLEQAGVFAVPMVLPAGAEALTVVGRELPPDAARQLSLRIVEVRPGSARAVQSARYDDVGVFFLDRGVFIEPDGFWVRGGGAAGFAVLADRAGTRAVATIQNGGSPNAVTVDIDGRVETWQMAPSEARRVDLDSGGPAGTVLRVTSPGGFRPSDDGVSADRRYLGVRVSIAVER